MPFQIHNYIAMLGRGLSPRKWLSVWKEMEGQSSTEFFGKITRWANTQVATASHVSTYRHMWWANPLGIGFMLYMFYKAWNMIYMVQKQKNTAQLVAAAYGQGGQWLNPVPK